MTRIFETYSGDFVVRFGAVLTYFLCAAAAGLAYMDFALGIRALWMQRGKKR